MYGMYFGIGELCVTTLKRRMASDGVNDEQFWLWSSQIVRGVADIHRLGIIHLAIQARRLALVTLCVC